MTGVQTCALPICLPAAGKKGHPMFLDAPGTCEFQEGLEFAIGGAENFDCLHRNRSRVQRFRGSRFHSCPQAAFGMRIYEKSVSFVRPNPRFGTKLTITWGNEYC